MTQATSNVDTFIEHYSRADVIAKYITKSAGAGIEHVLANVYGPIYLRVIQELTAQRPKQHRFRILEYGCGGGMNLLKLVDLLRSAGVQLDKGYGTDFSPPMVEAARREAAAHLSEDTLSSLAFVVAHNADLITGLSRSLSVSYEQLSNSFDLIVGVNTTRYCHRLKRETECARHIFDLLSPGGYSIVIDMNRYFPLFRSNFRNIFKPHSEVYIPTLKEYTRPFREVGFRIEESRNFCWVPHSAGTGLVAVCRTLTPVLDMCLSPFAMRSLVIGRKPH
jgi:SAM-dependent methyltransferase